MTTAIEAPVQLVLPVGDGRPRMACCGALDLGPSSRGGRPFQCLCQFRAFRAGLPWCPECESTPCRCPR